MKILINGYEVDLTLEDEKNLSDVITSISEWARQRNLIFTQFAVDGDTFLIDSFIDRPCDDIKILNCIIQSRADLIISTLTEGVNYCDRLLSFIAEAEKHQVFDLNEADSFYKGTHWLVDTLHSIFQLLSLNPEEIRYLDHSVKEYLSALIDCSEKILAAETEKDALSVIGRTRDVVDIVKGIFKMLFLSDSLKDTIVQSLESPDELAKVLQQVRDEIPAQEDSLAAASASFQSGRDAEGAEKLQQFTDFVYRYIRVCHQISPVFGIDPAKLVSDDVTLETVNANLHGYLESIVSAMENGDIVSLSDILEYEVKPQLPTILLFVNIMLEKMGR